MSAPQRSRGGVMQSEGLVDALEDQVKLVPRLEPFVELDCFGAAGF